ncbi:hypothetical protein SDC9_180026 [bioreactor metagenome]|uniref:UPF0033 domain-containing protein n=1 Tax=bioreactor metagenome TaxID=1076179 RepID=A0A645H0J1_9ZZZZ
MKTVDARGLSCPEPVLLTRKAVSQGLPMEVYVDHEVALENILRFCSKENLKAEFQKKEEYYLIHIEK